MTSIIDMIDHAIADHELSADAMRWTPDPPASAGGHAAAGQRITAFVESCGLALDTWQRHVLESHIDVHIQATAAAILRAVTDAMKAVAQLLPPPALLTSRRPERVTRMHRAYRVRRRRRW